LHRHEHDRIKQVETRRQAKYERTGWFRRKGQYFWKCYCRPLWEDSLYEQFRRFVEMNLFGSTHTEAVWVVIDNRN